MDKRVSWLTVLNAAERLRRMRTDDSLADLVAWKVLSDIHKGRFCGVCHVEARVVRILEVILGTTERQLIVDNTFEDFRKKREKKWYWLVVADVWCIQSGFLQDGNHPCCLGFSGHMTSCYGVINDCRDEGEMALWDGLDSRVMWKGSDPAGRQWDCRTR